MLSRTLGALLLSCNCLVSMVRGDVSQSIDHVVIDGNTIPFGTEIEVSGLCLSTDSFELECAHASLRGLRMNDKLPQEIIDFHLCGSEEKNEVSYEQLRKLEKGKYYLIRGRLMSAHFHGSRNVCLMVVTHLEAAPEFPLAFADLLDREATFEGTAIPVARFKHGNDTAVVREIGAWPKSIDGKQISIRGVVHRDSAGWRIDDPHWEPIDIEDQVGQPVSLEGELMSVNDNWWFRYRDVKLYLTSAAGPKMSFGSNDFRRRARVTGTLVRQDRPSLDRLYGRSVPGLVGCYVVRDAKAEYLEEPLTWEVRSKTLYPSFHQVHDGVPELLAESSFRRGLIGTETQAKLYAERNSDVIEAILRDAAPATRDLLAKRMEDDKVDKVLRLLYAAMLANVNDERGRSKLFQMTETKDERVNIDAIYCLGIFPFLLSAQVPITTDIRWAEERMISLIKNQQRATVVGKTFWGDLYGSKLTVAEIVGMCSSIPNVLGMLDSEQTRSALMEQIPSHVGILCSSKSAIPLENLLKLEAASQHRSTRRDVMLRMLYEKHTKEIKRFAKDLDDGFVYMDLRRNLSPELLAELKSMVASLTGQAKVHVQMLIVLGEKDPIPTLLLLLDDPNWTDKNLALYELARFGDPRAVATVARVLRAAPQGYFPKEDSAHGVHRGLEAIAHAGTSEAIRELIELLSFDLTRFGSDYYSRADFQEHVAIHLIDLTGESFGTNAEAWRKWQTEHPEFSVSRELANPNDVFGKYANNQIDIDFLR